MTQAVSTFYVPAAHAQAFSDALHHIANEREVDKFTSVVEDEIGAIFEEYGEVEREATWNRVTVPLARARTQAICRRVTEQEPAVRMRDIHTAIALYTLDEWAPQETEISQ